FILAGLVEKGLSPSPPASRSALIRRLTYDLTGLPPSPEEVETFLNDDRPGAYERLVDRLLDSPHYGEQWGRHWLDVVRFGESNGFERNVLINSLWPFRDYVIRSFNEDKPFRQLVLEHLAGDVIGGGDPDVAVGTAFLVCGPYDNVGNQDAAQAAVIRANTIDEMIRATGEAFLGLTIGCARCHDHKFDPILQEDYHSLYATFAGVHHGQRVIATPEQQQERTAKLQPLQQGQQELTARRDSLQAEINKRADAAAAEEEAKWVRPPVSRYGTEETFEPVEARHVRLVVLSRDDAPTARSGFTIDEFEIWTAGDKARNVARASNGSTAEGASRVAQDFAEAYSASLTIDGQFGAQWIAAGPELTITLARPERITRVLFSSDRKQSLDKRHGLTRFVGDYRVEVSLDGNERTTIASSDDPQPPTPAQRRQRLIDRVTTDAERISLAEINRELADVNRQIAAVPAPPTWWVGQFHPAEGPFHVFIGGDPQRKGKTVAPASLSVLKNDSGDYALPAGASEAERRRRLAEWIASPDNPLTPRVLVNRIWHYHFGNGIVDTPSDFGYMGGRPTHPELLDWLARQLIADGWRQKPLHKRIVMSQAYRQASTWRREAAASDGDSRMLWRYPPRRLTGEEIRDSMLMLAGKLDRTMGGPGFRLYEYQQDNVATYVPLDNPGPETYRRAVYHQNARAQRVDVLSDFDCPDPAFAAARRAATTTPLQALTMLNHEFPVSIAEAIAERLEREAGDDTAAQIRRGFQIAFAREPEADELARTLRVVEQHGLRAFCRAVLNASEMIYLQ
ncbi:MAG: DUF1553 domain-containing protein, partial [Maioricimonas sp. JB049]